MNPSDASSFFEILDEESLIENNPLVVEFQGRKIAIARSGGALFAVDNTCPHLGGSLGKGTIKNNCIVCPLHHWSFELSTGRCVDGVADEKIAVHEARIENGKIVLKL